MEIMIDKRFSRAYVEVLEIIKCMEEEYQAKVPKKLLELFEKNKAKDYVYHMDSSIDLKYQHISKETIGILSVLELKYWATPKQKEILNQLLIENENKYQEELRTKYNPDNIFQNKTQTKISEIQEIDNQQSQNETVLVEIRENFFTKFIKKLKNIFHIK